MALLSLQTNFTGGEIDPKLLAQIDLSRYKNGLRMARNVLCMAHGPVARRNGFRFVAPAYNTSSLVRLLKFQFSQDSAYILELGDKYIRVLKSDAVTNSAAAVTNGTFNTDLSGWQVTTTNSGTIVQSAGVAVFTRPSASDSATMTQNLRFLGLNPHSITFTTTGGSISYQFGGTTGTVPAGTYTVPFNPIVPGALLVPIIFTAVTGSVTSLDNVSVSNSPLVLLSPYTQDQLASINYVQFGNSLFLSQFNNPVQQIQWSGDGQWEIFPLALSIPPTYESGQTFTSGSLTTPTAQNVNIQVLNSDGSNFFAAADVGRQITFPAYNLTGTISQYSSTTQVAVTFDQTIGTYLPPNTTFPGGSWSMLGSPRSSVQIRGEVQTSNNPILYSFSPKTDGDYRPAATLTPNLAPSPGSMLASAAAWSSTDVGSYIFNLTGPGVSLISAFTDSTHVNVTTIENWPNVGPIGSQGWSVRKPRPAFRSGDNPNGLNNYTGKYILFNDGVWQIVSVQTNDRIEVQQLKAPTSTTATTAWTLETAAWTAANGYPRTITLHQQRLVLSSNALFPQTVWMSQSGLFNNFGIGSQANDSVSLDISTSEVNEAQWMASMDDLAIGTTGSELLISSGTNNVVLTPSTLAQKTQGYSGSSVQQPVLLEGEVLYIQRSGRKINSFKYDVSANQLISETITFLAETLTTGVLKEMIVKRDPSPVIYAVLKDGTLLTGTYLRSENVIAWSLNSTDGFFESINVISVNTQDEVWVVVRRVINGVTTRYIERLGTNDGTNSIAGFSDSFLTYNLPITINTMTNANPGVFTTATAHSFNNGDKVKMFGTGIKTLDGKTFLVANSTSTTYTLTDTTGVVLNTTTLGTITTGALVYKLVTVISGLSYLEGKSVQVKVDGAVISNITVVGGSITLPNPAYQVVVGLAYTSTIQTLDLVYQVNAGPQQAQPVRHSRPVLRVLNSTIPVINGEYLPARDPTMFMDNKVPLFTGDLVYGGLTYDQTGRLQIETSAPLPLVLLGIFSTIDSGLK